MVIKASHTGLRDWLIQRITAVVMGLYLVLIVFYLLANQPLQFSQWRHFFDGALIKMATLLTLLAMLWHTWLGLWVVLTDYVKKTTLRKTLQTLVIILLLAYVLWAVEILV